MRRLILALDDAFDAEASPWRQKLPGLEPFLDGGRVGRLAPIPREGFREAAFLGLPPGRVTMAEGPLVVAALGADPPERTLHFRVALLGTDGLPFKGEVPELPLLLRRLDTARLTHVGTEGLVMEGWPDLGTFPPESGRWPDGEAERLVRRWMDDAANELMATETAEIARGEGRPAPALLWPYAHGRREDVPRLATLRRLIVGVETDSLPFRGLVRLVGYRPGRELRHGTPTRLARGRAWEGDPEERAYDVRRLTDSLDFDTLDRLLILVPGPDGGLFLDWTRGLDESSGLPLDEEIVRDGAGRAADVHDLARAALTPLAVD